MRWEDIIKQAEAQPTMESLIAFARDQELWLEYKTDRALKFSPFELNGLTTSSPDLLEFTPERWTLVDPQIEISQIESHIFFREGQLDRLKCRVARERVYTKRQNSVHQDSTSTSQPNESK